MTFGYVATNLPFVLWADNLFELANESTILLVMTLCVRFADAAPDPLIANTFGFYIIGIIILNIGANMSIFIFSNLQMIYLTIKAFVLKRYPQAFQSTTTACDAVVKIQPEHSEPSENMKI